MRYKQNCCSFIVLCCVWTTFGLNIYFITYVTLIHIPILIDSLLWLAGWLTSQLKWCIKTNNNVWTAFLKLICTSLLLLLLLLSLPLSVVVVVVVVVVTVVVADDVTHTHCLPACLLPLFWILFNNFTGFIFKNLFRSKESGKVVSRQINL